MARYSSTATPGGCIPAMAAFAAQTVMRAMRWRSLFAHEPPPAARPVLSATMIGYLFNNIMPARAGEAARVVALTQRTGTPAAEIVGTAIVERAYDVFSILLIFFCASPWLPHESWFGTAAVLAGVGRPSALAVVVWVLAVHGDRPLRRLARPLARLPRLSRRADRARRGDARQGPLRAARAPRRARGAGLEPRRLDDLGAVGLARADSRFQPTLRFGAGMLVTVAIGLAMIIPSPPAAVGVFEAAGVLALTAYGVSQPRRSRTRSCCTSRTSSRSSRSARRRSHPAARRPPGEARPRPILDGDPRRRERLRAGNGHLWRQLRHGRQAADRAAEDR